MASTFVKGLAVRFVEVSADKFDDMLNILPPVAWTGDRFMVGEPNDHRECSVTRLTRATYHAYWKVADKYYTAETDMTVPEFEQVTRHHIEANIVEPSA